MSRQQSKELQARWDGETIAFALDSLLRGRPVSPHGSHEGRVDMRGLVVEKSERVRINDQLSKISKLYEFDSKKIRDVDLSYSVLNDLRVNESVFENCIFDGAKLPGLRAYSAEFEKCSFKSALLRDTTLGAKEKGRKTGSLYKSCDFSGADLRDISAEHGRFLNCDFSASQWHGTQTLSAIFENCDFRDASISEVYFDGRKFDTNGLVGLSENKMMGCNFSSAKLEYTGFLAIDFRNLIAPTDGRYVLIPDFPSKVEIAVSRLEANGSREALGLTFIYKMAFTAARVMPNDAVGMLDFGNLSDDNSRLLAAVFELDR